MDLKEIPQSYRTGGLIVIFFSLGLFIFFFMTGGPLAIAEGVISFWLPFVGVSASLLIFGIGIRKGSKIAAYS